MEWTELTKGSIHPSPADETGHFDFCNGSVPFQPDTSCPAGNTEGSGADTKPTDSDDNDCFPASSSLLVQVSGCLDANTGFDGVPYQASAWPDGNTTLGRGFTPSILFEGNHVI